MPGSDLVVSRTATRQNQSDYYINDRKVPVKEVTTLLKAKGIDLETTAFSSSRCVCWHNPQQAALCHTFLRHVRLPAPCGCMRFRQGQMMTVQCFAASSLHSMLHSQGLHSNV